ncbi:MAG: T9SS type A sorting domain-containing protein, partial [Flavobacteriales bacterium]|nr:T9SS type A sorting domain-containing protein [Flavobacteriales bacterium]
LAFVFRNADGSLVGRSADGSDIYFPLSDGTFTAQLLSPSTDNVAIVSGETVNFDLLVSETADVVWTMNGNEVASGLQVTQLGYVFEETATGNYEMVYTADNGVDVLTGEVLVVVVDNPTIMDPPAGSLDGITYLDDVSVRLQLCAPNKENIFVVGDFNDWNIDLEYQMNLANDGETFWVEIDGLTPQMEYRFHYHIMPDDLRVGDAYSEKYLDPWNDQYINNATYPDLLEFPSGLTSNEPVSIIQTGVEDFVWTDQDYQRPDQENLIIYELLVRDFSTQRTWDFITDTLDYLENLGVNAIEIMPFVEFNGNDSWGYNNAMYFAPDKAYGPKETLQNFIDEAHNRGIAVIMDVAFNHADLPNPWLRMYWEGSAPSEENPWFNVTSPTTFSWFFDWNHESAKTKAFVKRFMEFWIEEYHLDGWRWDFTQGFTQNPPAGGDWNYDQGRIDILNEYGSHAWSVDPDVYMILEHWCDNSEETVLANNGFMLWGNVTHDYQEAAMGWGSNLNWANYQDRGWNSPHLVTYMESHDEERLMYKNLEYGNSNGGYDVQDLNTALDRIELTACFGMLLPGPKMIWQFGELGYDFSINYCPNGTISENCRTSAKPVKWDYYDDPHRYELYQVYSALNHLKLTEPAFSTTDYGFNGAGFEKTLHLNHETMDVVIAGNFSVNDITMYPWFQHTGTWYDYFSGESFVVNDQNMGIPFEAGEYHIYTDQPLELPDITSNIAELLSESELYVYPNPFSETLTVDLLPFVGQDVQVRLLDMTGRVVETPFAGNVMLNHTQIAFQAGESLVNGVYVLQVLGENGAYSKTLIRE